MPRGRLITIEGLDGAGKTTLATGLQSALGEWGVEVALLREPGGVAAAERIRELVKDPQLRIGAPAEALLYAAARAQLVEEAVDPKLEVGTWVLLDRFVDSSLVYQGAGRKLGIEQVRAINEFATGGLSADLTLLLVIEPKLGRSRTGARGRQADRLERESEDFFERISSAYAALAAAEPHRVVRIDAAQPPAAVLSSAIARIAELL